MKNSNKEEHLVERVLNGFDVVFERLLEFKKEKNSKLVIVRNDEIVQVWAEDFEDASNYRELMAMKW